MSGKWKKAAAAALMLCFVLCFCACAGEVIPEIDLTVSEEQPEGWDELSAAQRAQQLLPEKPVRIGFAQAGHESDWRIASTKACRQAFSEANGYDLLFFDADNNPAAQRDAVRGFIRERVDYILIDPIVADGWDAVLIEAAHAGIPVILIDRMIDCEERYYLAWFGSDFVLEGEYAGQWLQSYLSAAGRGREPIRIVTVNGTEGASAQTGRTKGFASYLEKNENWTLLAQENGDFTESGGRQVMEKYLETYPDIDVVVCQNDNEALGVCRALDEAEISYGKDGGIIILSFDASRAGLEAVLDGKIHADFECNPLSPLYAEEAVRRLEAGEKLTQKMHYLPEECFSFEENPGTLFVSSGMKKMTIVTEELLKSRIY